MKPLALLLTAFILACSVQVQTVGLKSVAIQKVGYDFLAIVGNRFHFLNNS